MGSQAVMAAPASALILFLKAVSRGDKKTESLFDEPVLVEGHTRKDGTYVKPYTAKRKKKQKTSHTAQLVLFDAEKKARQKPEPQPDLFEGPSTRSERKPEKSEQKPDLKEMVRDAAAWRYLNARIAENLTDKREKLKHMRQTTKGDLDAWLQDRFGLDPHEARQVSNAAGEEGGFTVSGDHVKWTGPGPEPVISDYPGISPDPAAALLSQHDPLGLELKHQSSDRYVVILPNPSEGQKPYKAQYFNESGLEPHAQHDSPEDAVRAVVSEGFTDMASGTIEKLAQSEKWGKEYKTEEPDKAVGEEKRIVSPDEIPFERAEAAYLGSSFSPGKRAKHAQQEYADQLQSDYERLSRQAKTDEQKDMLGEEFSRYKSGYRQRYLAALDADSRTMSPMITGPAKFPVARNQKAMDVAAKRWGELEDYRKRAIRAIEKKLDPTKFGISSDRDNAVDLLKQKLAKLEDLQAKMKAANAAIRKNDDAKLKELGFNDEQIAKLKEKDFTGRVGFANYQLTNNNAEIRRIKERIDGLEKKSQDQDQELQGENARVLDNVEDNRVQVFFDGKPPEEVRTELKKHGFKWSPKNQAWQRQRSNQAMYWAKQIAGVSEHAEPKEGDTKTENGITYELRGGRWHRVTPEETHEDIHQAADTLTEAGQPFTADQLADKWSGGDREAAMDHLYAHPDRYALVDPDAQTWQRMDDYLSHDLMDKLQQVRDRLDSSNISNADRARLSRQQERLLEKLKESPLSPEEEAKYKRWMAHDMEAAAQAQAMAEQEAEVRQNLPHEQAETWATDQEHQFHKEQRTRFLNRDEEEKPASPHDEPSLNPNDPNYIYRDTGHIPGARKELAVQQIKRASRDGKQLRRNAIDWAAIEENSRQARELITKGNLFGTVDWDALREKGMTPAAGFLVGKIYASVAAKPEDDPQARQDYALGLESLRDRLEDTKTVEDVVNLIDEIKDERYGVMLNETEAVHYKQLKERAMAARQAWRDLEDEDKALTQPWHAAMNQTNKLKYEIGKRERRGWKPSEELNEQYKAAQEAQDRALQAWMAWKREKLGGEKVSIMDAPPRKEYEILSGMQQAIVSGAKARNLVENPVTRAWNALGEDFGRVLNFRSYKGSQAFAKHVASAKAGYVTDWSWTDTTQRQPKGSTKQGTAFQLKVADHYDRKGGRDVGVSGTADLKDQFKLREVQSGNWVLDDVNSAKFHTEHAAGALADLADLLGEEDNKVSLNGRIGLAFGARGRGGKNAALAHYEPVQRVINLTKMGGGGSLAHEWFHALDNIMGEALTGQPGQTESFATLNPEILPAGPVRSAIEGLVETMTAGNHRVYDTVTYTEAEEKWARQNMEGYSGRNSRWGLTIRNAPDVDVAVDRLRDLYEQGGFGKIGSKRAIKQRDMAIKVAAIHKGGNPERQVDVPSGPGVSRYLFDAIQLDGGRKKPYWGAMHEMAARAFAGYSSDRLKNEGRLNDYLVSMAGNEYYSLGERPYPDGEERQKINAAFDQLIQALRDEQVLTKALWLLDAQVVGW